MLLLTSIATAAPVPKLAIIAEDQQLSSVADLLTVDLTSRHQVQLLERDQIGRVIKEQGLTAIHGGDFVKLGELLGADGLLFLDVALKETNQVMAARLAAVKPGVVLDFAEYPFPVPEPEQWSRILVQRLEPLIPKLGVLRKDAIPISMLNLRSAVNSVQGESLERQLNTVLFNRLLHEREVFVLERQKLQALAAEKEFMGLGDEPFWNGSYLLEGTIDKAGYKEGQITLSARLTPPGEKAPVDFEASGPSNQASLITQELAGKILTWIKGQNVGQDWSAKDEAKRFFQEAQWAWRWSMVPEALAAADAAWALGHRDLDCAIIRVKAAADLSVHETPVLRQQQRQHAMRSPFAPRPWPALPPDPKDIKMTSRALSAFEEFRGTLPPEEPKLDSPVFDFGVESLTAASELLRTVDFRCFNYLDPQSGSPLSEPLADLRARARARKLDFSFPIRSRRLLAEFQRGQAGPWSLHGKARSALVRNGFRKVLV